MPNNPDAIGQERSSIQVPRPSETRPMYLHKKIVEQTCIRVKKVLWGTLFTMTYVFAPFANFQVNGIDTNAFTKNILSFSPIAHIYVLT